MATISEPTEREDRLDQLKESLSAPYHVIRGHRKGEVGALILLLMLFLAGFAPWIAPYEPLEKNANDDGTLKKLESPSNEHLLGTTRQGRDIFSQVILGARTALFIGFTAATIVILIGTSVGIVSGYYGGYVDELLMRITDIFYGIPLLPFAIVVLTVLEQSIGWIILIIGTLYWRNSARIIRSDVLKLREEEFIKKAQTTGASNLRIIVKQILPNVLPISLLYFAFATGFAIVQAASIAFLGFGDPNRISWGRMIFSAWNNNAVFVQPYWVAAPALMIVLVVTSVYFVGQTYEEVANPRLRDR